MKKIVVIGSGVMGRGIAYVSAASGFQTVLVDISDAQLKDAEKEISSIMQKGVQRGKMTENEVSNTWEKLHFSVSLASNAAEADLIIEAVPERLDIKRNIFEVIDQHASEDCIFASNTSTMSPTEIGSFTGRPDKVLAMHFFNPVHKMPLVEIVKGLETSDESVEFIRQTAEEMGKETVIINEFPGFVTSRISALVGNEAFYMLQEGVGTAEEIDKAIKLGLHYPMGPFELGDLVGLDTRLNNLTYLHEKLGEKYRPAPLLEQYVKAGRLGRKSGRGVYDYGERR
ncbi:3-hydroxybutyryl-CoA dehydrogenase [Bacillus sp. NRRL B-14911]|uniref:3-hydroxybutyryl-CoA dehydrogenase n=1 Tax=Bacillus infantis NRRL B-14911 TaxID=1367477 RepID=U5L8K8_9BACI|nr:MULTISPECIES: 3-hydroxyacyl-CoA dehydrogenase [Bacillus]AGX04169.1 3-hydroxybutyryl-CoA dehydrogenase [Bacillus infantis NRRL B-14911]EAR66001.1 3-hydroxybutyryl-CoA dehydrogenase [Bacillus sp. NRRL B-14911]MCA1036792.1 3-hydroxyacyl-CoA dehydrogenase [Bacillus infantis]